MNITIIVTTHNRPKWLGEALDSIRASADRVRKQVPVRVLVVDDASATDEPRLVAERHGVDYLRLPSTVGTSAARVAGVGQVTSTHHAFFDDDDVMLPCWFPRHVEKMREGYDVISSSFWDADERLNKVKRWTLPLTTFDDLMHNKISANDGSLIRHAALDGIAWRPDREDVMMMSLWLALAHRGARFATINEPCWLYRYHAGNHTPSTYTQRDTDFRNIAMSEYR